ncbi:voltage-gated chloride channel family protein [Sphingobacterium sp. JUb56]|uniref:voltage-gated chloride channel family protein n=1 Tax=Sphingobacterium sp. JUb56 TaxID=2587145 RepID=UPI00161DBEA1|nr:voltage-gated chloride channel family protein [Sphingobacterium sp. JUb56]MBB2951848.1 H+/Cl- antiporter ClcA [Sphingobacterium sp. JUb56]
MSTKSNTLSKIALKEKTFCVLKWIAIAISVGFIVGSISAFFLTSLSWVTNYRDLHPVIMLGLPLAGLIIGLLYHYYGGASSKGNNLLLKEYYQSEQTIPLRMAPLVLFSTLLTHLFGGSAGREGTAVQIGGAIADQYSRIFKLTHDDRKILIIIGISAGFASVFGTPWAGALFGLEVITGGKSRLKALIPSIMTAFIANYACSFWNVSHTHYHIREIIPALNPQHLLYTVIAGIIFGLVAYLFTAFGDIFSYIFRKIQYPPLRPFIGGIVLIFLIWQLGTTQYIGLGIPTILASFESQLNSYDFIIKLLLTTFTLSAGFKGGEVTPLFFIGATLGNVLFGIIPLPMGLLAAMGFIAVFAGATNTPLACILMGVELFGFEASIYFAIACFVAYFFSGAKGIYTTQIITGPKHHFYLHIKKRQNDVYERLRNL